VIADILRSRGAEVAAYDPAVPKRHAYQLDKLSDAVGGADALALLAVQREFLELDWHSIAAMMADKPVLLDAKNRIPKSVEKINGAKLVSI